MPEHAAPTRSSGLRALLEQEGRGRLILLANHVLAAEPMATRRLMPHAGRILKVAPHGWPRLLEPFLPAPAPLQVMITRAGLLELLPMDAPGGLDLGPDGALPGDAGGEGGAARPDLEVVVDTADPLGLVARVLSGGTPRLQLSGDAQLATDVNWLAENLRWDLAADLERLFGPIPADRLRLWGLAVLRALREGVARLSATRTGR